MPRITKYNKKHPCGFWGGDFKHFEITEEDVYIDLGE